MLPNVLVHPSIWLYSFYSGLHAAIPLSTTQQEVAEPAAGPGSCANPLQVSAMEHAASRSFSTAWSQAAEPLLAPAYASENGWHHHLCLPTTLSCKFSV